MKPSAGEIKISESAKRLDVDNRISLSFYYRIAHNLLRQADIYRSEKDIIDLYVMLMRFSSLIKETIPHHKDFQVILHDEKLYFRKRLLSALNELEALKPDVKHQLEELNRRNRNQLTTWGQLPQDGSRNESFDWPSIKNYNTTQADRMVARDGLYRNSNVQGGKILTKSKSQFNKLSFNIPLPKEETLSRHSILGPNGLNGRWQPPSVDRGIQYPSNLDLTPIEMPSVLHQPTEDKPEAVKENVTLEKERSILEDVLSLQDTSTHQPEEPGPMINLDTFVETPKMEIIKELCPPPVLAEVHDVAITPQVSHSSNEQTVSLQNDLIPAESPQEVHIVGTPIYISIALMESFMRLAKSNTTRNLETCGVLAGSLKNRKFYVTALIIPKQESTSDSCQTTNEEEIFDYQDKQALFPLGWIHALITIFDFTWSTLTNFLLYNFQTHPTQSCFMSSIDVHTHYSYQIMLPEAIAIVMAPKDSSRKHGIFRLTTPGGMSVIKQCQQRGFHPHQPPPDGGPIYDHCPDVYMNPKLKFDVVDLR
ncbi:hypothetical protein ZIOFF_026989 [Zingiber officinale]|uniref:MPN domain-containing protein n=1 Tax=Zingiber officinale TaxID=94328 RepID=A0A8J5H5L3_ZINOF|nr:hypothetical protein ZIOFF_026989 [Zingiber officinale]